jgi:hypothetical protein
LNLLPLLSTDEFEFDNDKKNKIKFNNYNDYKKKLMALMQADHPTPSTCSEALLQCLETTLLSRA